VTEDPFDTARTNFAGLGDFEGRAVLVLPTELQKDIPSNRAGGGTYERVVADVIVLDGDLDDELGIDELPAIFDGMFISGSVVVPQLRGSLKNRKPKLGVVVKQPARTKGNNPAILLDGDAITEDQKKLARKAWEAYQARLDDAFQTA
jgi:hypothetical protein